VKEYRFEDVIVDVDSIKNGKVHGRIANKLGIVTNYHYDQALTFPESDVMNWLFVRPEVLKKEIFSATFWITISRSRTLRHRLAWVYPWLVSGRLRRAGPT